MNQAFHTRRTTGKLWKSSTRVVVSNMARREKHHRMEMCGILQLINWQKSSETHCFFFCLALLPGHELTSRKYSLPSASVSAARHVSVRTRHTCVEKKDKIMIEIHIKNMKDTRSPAGHCRRPLSAFIWSNCVTSVCGFLRTCILTSWTDTTVLFMFLSQTHTATADKKQEN